MAVTPLPDATSLLVAMRFAGMLLYLSPDDHHVAYEAPFDVPDGLKFRATQNAESLCKLIYHLGSC